MLFTSLGGTTWAWDSPQIIVLIVLGVVLLARVRARRESRASEPILPLSLFRNRTFAIDERRSASSSAFALFGAVTYLPLYLQIDEGVRARPAPASS